jgi:hypothetical protein
MLSPSQAAGKGGAGGCARRARWLPVIAFDLVLPEMQRHGRFFEGNPRPFGVVEVLDATTSCGELDSLKV